MIRSVNPTISVIVPAYNEEKYIEPTLQSVVQQNSSGLELIVVPNGCTDKTVEVAGKFTPLVYDTSRKGIGLAKNIGYEKATGACLFSTHDQLDALRKRDGHLFREDIKTMEDVDLISRLRAEGPFKFLTEKGVITSTRRFEGEGYARRFFMDFVEYLNTEGIEQRRDVR